MDARDYGRPKLVIHARVFDSPDAGFDFSGFCAGADGRVVIFKGGLDVHSHVGDELVAEDLAEDVRAAAVGIELDGKAEGGELFEEGDEVALEGGLTARHHDALEVRFAFGNPRQDFLFRDARGKAIGDDKLRATAVGTTPIAALGEDNGSR